MGKGFVYRGKGRTADDISKKAKEGTRDFDGIFTPGLPTFKPKEGENQVRILPSGDEDNPDWDLIVHTHYDVGPDNARYLCLAKMKEEECPVCEAKAEAVDEDEADKLRVAKGAICWVIDRDNEKAGPQLWSIPFTKVRNEIHARSIDKKSRTPLLIDHPEEGYDVLFNRKGTDQRTQYTGVEVDRDPTPLHDNEKLQQRWLDFVAEHPLADCLKYYDYDYIKKTLYGKSAKKKDDDEDEAPRRRLRKDDDDEDDKPSRSSRRGRASADDDDDETPQIRRGGARRSAEDDEDDDKPVTRRRPKDEDDEEETPRSRKKDLDDDIPFEGSKTRRRALLDEDADDEPAPKRGKKPAEDEDDAEDEDAPSASAKRALKGLRPAGKRR